MLNMQSLIGDSDLYILTTGNLKKEEKPLLQMQMALQ
jgi:hypothetical protein